MAKFTAGVDLKIRLPGGFEAIGVAGTTHRIPDSLVEEFTRDQVPLIPGGVTWITQDETSNIPTLPIAQTDVSGLTAALAAKFDKAGGIISGATTVTAALVAQASVSTPSMSATSVSASSLTATTARFKGGPWYDVRGYGAAGDGTTDDTAAVQSAVDAAAAAGGGTIVYPPGSYKITTVTITTAHVNMQGFGGVIVDGTVRIGVSTQTAAYSYYDSLISGLSFIRSATSTSVNAIEFQRAYRVTVRDCYFEKYNAAIKVNPLSTSAPHVGQLIIDGCRGTKDNNSGTERRCRYLVYIAGNTNTATAFAAADCQVSNNNFDALVSNVHADAVDGLIVVGNTFFLGSYSEVSTVKESNVRVLKGAQVIVSSNQLFEAGYEAILLQNCQNFSVVGNVIVWPGERDLKSGVAVIGGDYNSAAFNLGSIAGNTIMFPSRHGVSIEGVSGNVVVSGNQVRAAGFNGGQYYGGTAIGSVSHVIVNVESTATDVLVIGNLGAGNTSGGILGTGFFDANHDDNEEAQRKIQSSTISSTSATVSAIGVSRIIFNMATTATITTINGGYDGQELMLYNSTVNNPTIQHNTNVRLKASANATIAVNSALTLRYISSVPAWVEIARSF